MPYTSYLISSLHHLRSQTKRKYKGRAAVGPFSVFLHHHHLEKKGANRPSNSKGKSGKPSIKSILNKHYPPHFSFSFIHSRILVIPISTSSEPTHTHTPSLEDILFFFFFSWASFNISFKMDLLSFIFQSTQQLKITNGP